MSEKFYCQFPACRKAVKTKAKKQTRKAKQSDADFLRSCGIAP